MRTVSGHCSRTSLREVHAGHAGHALVTQDHADRLALQQAARLLGAAGGEHGEVFVQRAAQRVLRTHLVIDHQHGGQKRQGAAAGSRRGQSKRRFIVGAQGPRQRERRWCKAPAAPRQLWNRLCRATGCVPLPSAEGAPERGGSRAQRRRAGVNRSSGSCSPLSQSTTRRPPKRVSICTKWCGSVVTSPMRAASCPSGWARSAASAASATSAATMATSLPSLATYSGSRPRSSQAASTCGFDRDGRFLQPHADGGLLRDLVERGGQAAACRVAQHAHRTGCCLHQVGHHRVQRRGVAFDGGFEGQRFALREHRHTVGRRWCPTAG